MDNTSDTPTALEQRSAGPELRLLDRRAFVGFPPLPIGPGLTITDFALQIPDVSFPFNVSAGAAKYQRKQLKLGFLELQLESDIVARHVKEASARLTELTDLQLHFRNGYLEGEARFIAGERAPLTFKVALDGEQERLTFYLYDVRLFGFSTFSAAQVPVLVAKAVEELALLPQVKARGATGFSAEVLPALARMAAVSRGYRMPLLEGARLGAVDVTARGLKLRFATGGLPPPASSDEELMLALEGSRAFADAEKWIAEGKIAQAREMYLRSGDLNDAHPFAAERLLTLLVADPQAHELALDVAASLLRRREGSATPLWAEAVVRERRGEHARSAERFLALCTLARKRLEDAAAFHAAQAAARVAGEHAPQLAVKALHELLGLRPDHLPSLQALAKASDLAKDWAGAIRAYRRIAALARDPSDAAHAHVRMAFLCAKTEEDAAGARLHCEAALRLAPDEPEALYLLADLCHRSGEHLRAIKTLDRLREVALARHDIERVGQASQLAGRVWETGLKQPENALLRYREAASLLPGTPEPLYHQARVAESLGKLSEAVAGYQQALELAGPSPSNPDVRAAVHQSHHAMARLLRTRIGDPVKAREHFEKALAFDPKDQLALAELIPYFRASSRYAELADACEKAAAITEASDKRAALLAEAGELYRVRLGQPERAETLLTTALELDGKNTAALEGMLALAESRRDGPLLCRCLKALAELAKEPHDRAHHYRRLAVTARDLTFDLGLAASALEQVLQVDPEDLPSLGELCALQRRRVDMPGLASALEQRAKAAQTHGDKRLAASALRELAQVLETRLGRMGEAIVALERAAKLSPEPAVLLELADLSLRVERPMAARRALEDVLSLLPKHTSAERLGEIHARLGRACDLLGDRDAALRSYELALASRKLDDDLCARLEALYEEAGSFQQLAQLWAERAKALLGVLRHEDAAVLFGKSARAFLRLGEKEKALASFEAALTASPDGPEASLTLDAMAQVELERGERWNAAKLLARRAQLTHDARQVARLYLRASGLAHGHDEEQVYLEQAVERDPSFPAARIRRAEWWHSQHPGRALADYEAALQAVPEDADSVKDRDRPPLLRAAAQAALQSGQKDSARRWLTEYARARPQDEEALRLLANLYRESGDRALLCDLLAVLWPLLQGPERAQARREHVELLLALGRTSQAVQSLRSHLELYPDERWAASALLTQLEGEGSVAEDEKLRLLTLLLSEGGEANTAWRSARAQLYRRRGRWNEAKADLAAAAAQSSEPGPFYEALAQLCKEQDQPLEELQALLSAMEAESVYAPGHVARVLELGMRLLNEKNSEAARRGFQAALTHATSGTQRSQAHWGLAHVSLSAQAWREAADALGHAAEEGEHEDRVRALLERAQIFEKIQSLEDAAHSYQSVLSLTPHHGNATRGLKRVLKALGASGRLAAALEVEAGAAGKAGAGLYDELGALYAERLSDPKRAERAWRQALALEPEHGSVRTSLARLLASQERWEEAALLLEKVAAGSVPSEAALLLREAAGHAKSAQLPELALRLSLAAHQQVPAQGVALLELAELLDVRGRQAEALPLYDALSSTLTFDTDGEGAERVLLRQAVLAHDAGNDAAAKSAYRKIIDHHPASVPASEGLANLLAATDPRASVEVLWKLASRLPASPENVQRTLELAHRSQQTLADLPLAIRMLEHSAGQSEDALPIQLERASLLRQTGRTSELMEVLTAIAQMCLGDSDLPGARRAYEEVVALSEHAGRVDDALKTLSTLRQMTEKAGLNVDAARYERQRGELLRDAKQDLAGASAALAESFGLQASEDVVQLGIALARRQERPDQEVLWLTRSAELAPDPQNKAKALAKAARLWAHALSSPADAESAARRALALDPGCLDAEVFLVQLLEENGQLAELAAYYEQAAGRAAEPPVRRQLALRAASIYRDRAGQPEAAAAVLLAAHSADPDDSELTACVADQLHDVGRHEEGAEFDALVLAGAPFTEPSFQRHVAYLTSQQDFVALAQLHLGRAKQSRGQDAARAYLSAAASFRRAGDETRAQSCEDEAFDRAPALDEAYQALAQRDADVRSKADVLWARAQAVPDEAPALLAERARLLRDAGESLLAAEAYDALLAVSPNDASALAARAELAAQDGGPLAAQPYDRRLVGLGEAPAALVVRAQLRLGHAAMGAGAFQDAADALQAVVDAEASGPRRDEALGLLAEAYARIQNPRGLLQTTLERAKRAAPEEAEALLRRAAGLFEAPEEVMEALWPLAQRHPGETALVERTLQGLKTLGRHSDRLELSVRHAQAVGGALALRYLLEAADIAEGELADAARASALRDQAATVDPENPDSWRILRALALRRGETARAEQALVALANVAESPQEANAYRLDLARMALSRSDVSLAQEFLEAIVRQGALAPHVSPALEMLQPLLEQVSRQQASDKQASEAAAADTLLGRVLLMRADETQGETRAERLSAAADVFIRLGDEGAALHALEGAVRAQPNTSRWVALAAVFLRRGDVIRAASSLERGAEYTEEPAQARALVLRAADLLRSSGAAVEEAALLARAEARWSPVLPAPELAARFEQAGAKDKAAPLYGQILQTPAAYSIETRQTALIHSAELPEHVLRMQQAISAADPNDKVWVDALCVKAQLLAEDAAADAVLALAVERFPSHRKSLLAERYDRFERVQNWAGAAEVLERIVQDEITLPHRTELRVKLAGIWKDQLQEPSRARVHWEAALAEGREQPEVLAPLVEAAWADRDMVHFTSWMEKWMAQDDIVPLARYGDALVDAYLAQGRADHAVATLRRLPETDERMERRIVLATQLGYAEEVLVLRAQRETDEPALEKILVGLLELNLLAPASRVAERLLQKNGISPAIRRFVADKLSSSEEGANVAVALWPSLLRQNMGDGEAWTSYAQSLRLTGQTLEAAIMDGFGVVFSGTQAPAEPVWVRPVHLPPMPQFEALPVTPLWEVTAASMPRLHATLRPVLETLGAGTVKVFLNATGGVEAYLASPNELIVGAGALGCFGSTELVFLCALALALADKGVGLADHSIASEDLERAGITAYEAVPSPIAAGRVFTHLDASVRGRDPKTVSWREVARNNQPLHSLAHAVLKP